MVETTPPTTTPYTNHEGDLESRFLTAPALADTSGTCPTCGHRDDLDDTLTADAHTQWIKCDHARHGASGQWYHSRCELILTASEVKRVHDDDVYTCLECRRKDRALERESQPDQQPPPKRRAKDPELHYCSPVCCGRQRESLGCEVGMGLSITRMHRDAILKVVRDLDAQIEHRKQPQKGERIKVKENAVATEARLIHWGASNAYYVPMSDQDGPCREDPTRTAGESEQASSGSQQQPARANCPGSLSPIAIAIGMV